MYSGSKLSVWSIDLHVYRPVINKSRDSVDGCFHNGHRWRFWGDTILILTAIIHNTHKWKFIWIYETWNISLGYFILRKIHNRCWHCNGTYISLNWVNWIESYLLIVFFQMKYEIVPDIWIFPFFSFYH